MTLPGRHAHLGWQSHEIAVHGGRDVHGEDQGIGDEMPRAQRLAAPHAAPHALLRVALAEAAGSGPLGSWRLGRRIDFRARAIADFADANH